MRTLTLIGDVHGKYDRYKRLIAKQPNTIQVGDMGVGFRRISGWREGTYLANPPHYAMLLGNHRFIRGNHDNPKVCAQHSQCIQDGTVEDGMMFVGGGFSIDKAYRVENYSWWADEELSHEQLEKVITVYLFEKPDVMITHDCPEEIGTELVRLASGDSSKLKTRTGQAFQSMWSAHSPKLWVFGHYHYSFDAVLRGTRFVCLNELECRTFEI